MWSGGKEFNDDGESVVLYQTIDKFENNKKALVPGIAEGDETTAFCSHLGGTSKFFAGDRNVPNEEEFKRCSNCEGPLFQIIQLHAPIPSLDRSLYVYGCNNASCIQQLFTSTSNFHLGGNGIITCLRSQQPSASTDINQNKNTQNEQPTLKSKIVEKSSSEWWDDTANNTDDWFDGDDEWGDCGNNSETKNDATTMEDLEAMLNAMEASNSAETKKKKKNTKKKTMNEQPAPANSIKNKIIPKGMFPKLDLEFFEEPYHGSFSKANNFDDDDDDVDMSNEDDNGKINLLLSKYLKEEEDEELVRLIQTGACAPTSNSNKGGNNEERYEKMSQQEIIFQSFTNRMKRAPHQVVRYAYGGIPMWSIPTPSSTVTKDTKQKFPNKNKNKTMENSRHDDGMFPKIPLCPCGAKRTFEFQIMPSALHILNVDEFNNTAEATDKKDHTIESMFQSSGMNWGVIAIYSCHHSCEVSNQEFVVVQKSNDEKPTLKKLIPIKDNMETPQDDDDDDETEGA